MKTRGNAPNDPIKEQARICRELGTPHGLVLSLANQARIIAGDFADMEQALPLTEEACELAVEHGFDSLVG